MGAFGRQASKIVGWCCAKKFFFLWPLATATAAALGPVPPSPFALAAIFAAQQRSSEKL
jgi:hypothetical protein